MLMHLLNLAALTYSSFEDFKNQRFNFLIPLAAIITSFALVENFNLFFFLTFAMLIGLGKYLQYFKTGDIIPLTLYMLPFTSIQALFTLLTGVGLYLYAWPKIFEETRYAPLIPAITLCYLIQLLLF